MWIAERDGDTARFAAGMPKSIFSGAARIPKQRARMRDQEGYIQC